MRKAILIMVIFVTLAQCSDNDDTLFKGVTETDLFGDKVGTIDESDWQIDEIWNKHEISLFSDLGLANLNNVNIESTEKKRILEELGDCFAGGRTASACALVNVVDPAYPNPATNTISLSFNIDDTDDILNFRIVIVNQNFDKLVELDEYSATYQFMIGQNSSIKSRKIYRIYYLIQTIYGDFVFKGHGDFRTTDG